ncbi:P-loop containing nucleoside triphosphate hydrolase protein [Xylaria sp. FL0043]|nr:P-loop containing nucleoside triphosphate hydrolase protein [Xylaria sp. FL0043]
MATANSVGTLEASGYGRVHVGNIYNSVPERPETPPKPSFNIPYRRDNEFVKRKSVLDRLHQICLKPASRAALVGLGGLGKSQLAIEQAYRMRDMCSHDKKEIWAFLIHATTRARVEQGFKAIADAVKIPGRNNPGADILQLVYRWLGNEHNGHWLIILDSADDVDVFYDVDEKAKQSASVERGKRALSSYLPQSSNGSIIVTTRDKRLAYKITGSYNNIVEVGPMDQDDALELLRIKSGPYYNKEDGAKVVQALECMPLAISQAAAYIQERTSIKGFLRKFQKSEQDKSSLLRYDAGDLRRDGSASNSLLITWQISFDSIRSKRPSAADLLSRMSFFDCEGIPDYLVRLTDKDKDYADEAQSDNESIASSKASDHEFEDDITILKNYCLITANERGDVFEMHGLVQLSTRIWLDVHGETEKFKKQYLSRMARAFPGRIFENWGIYRQLFPHAEKALHYRPNNQDNNKSLIDWTDILFYSGWFSNEQGKYTIAEKMMTMARDARSTALGLEDTRTLDVMHELASTYWHQRRHKEAESLYTQVVEIMTRVQGPEDLRTLGSMNNLALAYHDLQRWDEAELLCLQVLKFQKKVRGPEHPHTLTTIHNLAATYSKQKRWEEAELLYVQVLETEERVLGPEHPNTLTTMHNLARTYLEQERWKEAELLQVQVLDLRKRVLGPEHPDTLYTMHSLAVTYSEQERWKEAELLYAQILEIRKRVLGPEHPDTLHTMYHLALTYSEQERWKEAELLEVQVLEISKRVLGPEHPGTLNTMHNLAWTWNKLGRGHDALELMEQCYELRVQVLGSEHPDTQDSLSFLQDWRMEERETPKREQKPRLKNTILSLRTRFRQTTGREDTNDDWVLL